MYSLFEIPPGAKKLLNRSREALDKVLAAVKSTGNVLIPITPDLYADQNRWGKLYRLTSGQLSLIIRDEIVFTFEEGDLVGLEHAFGLSEAKVSGEFAVRADEYDAAALQESIVSAGMTSLWNEYLTTRLNGETRIIAALGRGEKQFTPEIRNHQPGETIIAEGTSADEVYTLLQGHLNVLVGGVKVGEILPDEIFGALAALTESPRTATVVTSEESLVLSLRRDKFLELMQHRPGTVLNMVKDMARTIVDLNEKVVKLSGTASSEERSVKI
jgi:CRP/FNR family transcriptional regulator, cyclic AMP receptor protein